SMLPSSHRNTSVNTKEKHMSLKEYKLGTAFPGVIGLTVDQSSPAWPEPLRAREGTPNVLFIVLDDTGYGQLGCYGSPIEPPNLESAAGPYDRWPLGRGFERFYGFMGGDTHQYYPDLVYDNHQVEPPRTPEEGYHLNEDLADKAIQFIADARQVAPDKPFYLHYCPGATHAPHHVPKEWADRYDGMFDDGWDAYREKVFARQKELGIVPADAELSRHDPDVPDWNGLSPEARKLYARMMEVFAGFLSHTDYHIGRLLDYLKSIGEFDNTLIMVISDNGASAEGGPTGTTNELQF